MELLRYVLLGLAISWSTEFMFIVAVHLIGSFLKIAFAYFITSGITFLVDLAISELVTALCNFHRQHPVPATAWPRWEVVSSFMPSSNERLVKVVWCDGDQFDDPFWPHVSIVYAVGIKCHGSFWQEVTIWRVSTLTGHRHNVCRFNYIDPWPPSSMSYNQLHVHAFHSRGVIFVYLTGATRARDLFEKSQLLLVYDLRHQKWAEILLGSSLGISKYARPLAIFCLGRRIGSDQAIDGWRIRFLGTSSTRNGFERRTVFFNATIDLSISKPDSPVMVAQDDLLFRCTRDVAVRSETRFGLHQRQGYTRVFVYNRTSNRFQVFPGRLDWVASDRVLQEYLRRVGMLYQSNSYPIVINDREAIVTKARETVFMRTWFKAPSLRMLMARNLFKAHPNLASMTSDQFRQLTGVDVGGHLG